MNLISKVKVVYAVAKNSNKRQLVRKVVSIVKKGGIRSLKNKIVESYEKRTPISVIIDEPVRNLYRVQQAKYIPSLIHDTDKSVCIILWIPAVDYFIDDTLRSIAAQTYPNIDVVICTPGEHDMTHIQSIFEYTTITDFESNLSDILDLTKSDYLYFLRAGNYLSPNAIEAFVFEFENNSDLVYSDECIWNFETSEISKYFLKPEFSEIYFYSNSYIQQSVCFKRNRVDKTKSVYTKISDFYILIDELVNECIGKSNRINHINSILLLRHEHYEYLANYDDINNKIESRHPNILNSDVGSISIVLVGNNYDLIKLTLESILENRLKTHNMILDICVCTTSALAKSIMGIKAFGGIIFKSGGEKYNYAEACNIGAEVVSGKNIMFIREGVYFEGLMFLREMLAFLSYDSVGAVSPKCLRGDNSLRYAGAIAGGLDLTPLAFNGEYKDSKVDSFETTNHSREVSVLSSTCILIKKDLFLKVDKFNEQDTPNKFSNTDLSFKIIDAGYKCLYCGTSIIKSNALEWYDNWFEDKDSGAYSYMLKKWIDYLKVDPYFSPELSKHALYRVPVEFSVFAPNHSSVNPLNIRRNILLITHELSLTGAPVALHYAAKALLNNGDYPIIISPTDGNLRKKIVDDGIPVIVDGSIFGANLWIKMAENFDAVIVSTFVCNSLISCLEDVRIPTLWWGHEARASYEIGALKNTMPHSVKENIHIYCGGEYAKNVLREYRPKFNSDLLLYAVPDFSCNIDHIDYSLPDINGKIVFAIIGSVMERKGQDILAKAIMKMQKSEVVKCKFIFIGSQIDVHIYNHVLEVKNMYPDNIVLIDEVSRDELMFFYQHCHSIICASRDDPMPIFMTEAMMFSKICICSENTGTAALIEDGVSGFIYRKDSSRQLRNKIMYVINHIDELDTMKQASRDIYLSHFTMDAFSRELTNVMDSIIEK